VATVAALQARAGGGKDPAPVLAAYDQGMMMRARGRRMNSGAQGKDRDGPPSQPAGMGSDALVPEGKGGEIASSVPAEIRARAQSAYKEAYTRAYHAYLGASPAAGDPTAIPLSAGCQCPGCKFLTQGLCPTPQPECATRCVDDPNSFCLYCVGPEGQARLVGRYPTPQAWVAAVQAQRTACGCGGGGGGNDVGECGTMYRMVTAEGSSTYPCCRDPKCDGTYRYMEFDCGVACNRTCTSGSCYPNPDRAPYTCDHGRIEYFSCKSCCGTCEGEDCGNGACSPYPSCWQSHLQTKSIGPECLCG
jgi:hypothetical protein